MCSEHLHIDLCCGLGGWQAPFEESPQWRSVGLDIRDDLTADVLADVRQLPLHQCKPELLTMSPPCTQFTKWKLPWYGEACSGNPDMQLINACLDAVEQVDPKHWILENVIGLHLFWKPARKHVGPFYFWGEFPPFDAETVYKDQRLQPKSSRSELSAKVPYHIGDALRQSVEIYS